MGVAFDAKSTLVLAININANTFTDFATLLTVGSSASFLVAGVEVESSTGSITNVAWDQAGTPQAMTQIGTVLALTGGNQPALISLWGLVNPHAGNNTLRITASGLTGADDAYVFGMSFTGTETSSVANATKGFAKNNATSTALSVASGVSLASTEMAVAFGIDTQSGFNNATTENMGGTQIGENQAGNNNGCAAYFTGAGSAVTASATLAASDIWGAVIIGITTPSGAGTKSPKYNLPKLQRPYRYGPLAGLQSVRGFPTATTVSISGLAVTQFKAAAASTSQLAAAARSEIQVKASAAVRATVPLASAAEIQVKAAGGLAGATAMTGRAAVQIKSAAVPTMAAALAGRATAMLKAVAAATAVVPLSALATTMVKAAGGITTGSFVALAARAAVMVKASATATSQAALSARATTMTKASAAAAGATAMAGQAAIMVKAAGAVTTGALVALSARCTVMVKAAAQQAQATVLAAHLTLQVKAQSPAPVQPAAGQFQLITSMAGFFNPGSSAIP